MKINNLLHNHLPNTIKVNPKPSLMYIIKFDQFNFIPILPQTKISEEKEMHNAFSQTEKRKYIEKKSNILQISKDYFQWGLTSK